MAQPTASNGERQTRRTAIMNTLAAICGVIGAALVVPLVGFFFGPAMRGMSGLSWRFLGESIPPTPRSRAPWTRIGDVSAFQQNVPTLTTVTLPIEQGWLRGDAPAAVYVRRTAPDQASILDVHCTHMGCPVRWNKGAARFFCPCHGGVFDGEGRVLSGPPPRPLDRYAVKVEQGVLYMGALELPGA